MEERLEWRYDACAVLLVFIGWGNGRGCGCRRLSTLFLIENQLGKVPIPANYRRREGTHRACLIHRVRRLVLRVSKVECFMTTIMFILGRLVHTVGGRVSCRRPERHDLMHGELVACHQERVGRVCGRTCEEGVTNHQRTRR